MKKGLLILGAALAVLVMAASVIGCDSFTGGSSEEIAPSVNQETGIWVTGVGKITVTPDLAILNLGVQAQAATVADAQAQAATAMAGVMSALKTNGVADKDITTSFYNVTPVYSYDRDTGKQTLEGYSVSNNATVKVRNVANAGVIIDAAAAAGGDYTRVNSVSFTIDKPETYNEQARDLAMKDASARAKQLASLGGVKLGQVIYISESVYTPFETRSYDSGVKAPSAVTTPISPGEMELTLQVQVVYSIS